MMMVLERETEKKTLLPLYFGWRNVENHTHHQPPPPHPFFLFTFRERSLHAFRVDDNFCTQQLQNNTVSASITIMKKKLVGLFLPEYSIVIGTLGWRSLFLARPPPPPALNWRLKKIIIKKISLVIYHPFFSREASAADHYQSLCGSLCSLHLFLSPPMASSTTSSMSPE